MGDRTGAFLAGKIEPGDSNRHRNPLFTLGGEERLEGWRIGFPAGEGINPRDPYLYFRPGEPPPESPVRDRFGKPGGAFSGLLT